MTLDGTNCYIVRGGGEAYLIDSGPNEPQHLAAMSKYLDAHALYLRGILLTHTHQDHIEGLDALKKLQNAPVYAFKEGFNERLRDGQRIAIGHSTLTVVHTPGHAGDCVCFFHDRDAVLIAGDTILGAGTSVISPPEGDVSDYLDALERLKQFPARTIAPGHGPMLSDPRAKIDEYIHHRLMREQQILAQLQGGPKSVDELVAVIYQDVDKKLHAAAGWSVRAHLTRLERAGRVTVQGQLYRLQ
jgi:glyoxylase-like metal-dependent hydrolase (beta-lactamase superfamily II)